MDVALYPSGRKARFFRTGISTREPVRAHPVVSDGLDRSNTPIPRWVFAKTHPVRDKIPGVKESLQKIFDDQPS